MMETKSPFRERSRSSPTIAAMAALARAEVAAEMPLAVHEVDDERLEELAGGPEASSVGLALVVAVWAAALGAIAISFGAMLACAVIASIATCFYVWVSNDDKVARQRALNELVEWPNRLPFRIASWRDLLCAPRPQLRIELQAPTNMGDLELALRTVDTTLDVRSVSPTVVYVGFARERVLGAKEVVERVLYPLHDELGIARVDGGSVNEVSL